MNAHTFLILRNWDLYSLRLLTKGIFLALNFLCEKVKTSAFLKPEKGEGLLVLLKILYFCIGKKTFWNHAGEKKSIEMQNMHKNASPQVNKPPWALHIAAWSPQVICNIHCDFLTLGNLPTFELPNYARTILAI